MTSRAVSPGNNNDSSGFEKLLEGALIALAGALSGNLAQTQYGWQITTKSNTINITEASNETQESESQLREEAKDAAQDYKLPDDWYNGHIVGQHGPDSDDSKKSKFNKNFYIKQGIEDTLEVDNTVEVKANNRDPKTGKERYGYVLEKIYDNPIGINDNGEPCSKLKVVLSNECSYIKITQIRI